MASEPQPAPCRRGYGSALGTVSSAKRRGKPHDDTSERPKKRPGIRAPRRGSRESAGNRNGTQHPGHRRFAPETPQLVEIWMTGFFYFFIGVFGVNIVYVKSHDLL